MNTRRIRDVLRNSHHELFAPVGVENEDIAPRLFAVVYRQKSWRRQVLAHTVRPLSLACIHLLSKVRSRCEVSADTLGVCTKIRPCFIHVTHFTIFQHLYFQTIVDWNLVYYTKYINKWFLPTWSSIFFRDVLNAVTWGFQDFFSFIYFCIVSAEYACIKFMHVLYCTSTWKPKQNFLLIVFSNAQIIRNKRLVRDHIVESFSVFWNGRRKQIGSSKHGGNVEVRFLFILYMHSIQRLCIRRVLWSSGCGPPGHEFLRNWFDAGKSESYRGHVHHIMLELNSIFVKRTRLERSARKLSICQPLAFNFQFVYICSSLHVGHM